jgi:hypothetical protein
LLTATSAVAAHLNYYRVRKPLSDGEAVETRRRAFAPRATDWWCFQIHRICFTVIPLVASEVFYGLGRGTTISYVDSLFFVTSAQTETMLNSALLAGCTTGQQIILFVSRVKDELKGGGN